MIQFIKRWLRKSIQASLGGSQWSGTAFVDSWRQRREPRPNELMAELKGMAWTCASLNSAVCAAYPPKLYVTTNEKQKPAKCKTAPIGPYKAKELRETLQIKSNTQIEEVAEHPVLDLLLAVNPVHNGFDLWELTQLYLEVHGRAYWALEMDEGLGIPSQIWPLPTQNVTAKRNPNSEQLVDYFEYRAGNTVKQYTPDQIVFFHYPDPRDPYLGGLSPLRACFEEMSLMSEYKATKLAIYANRGIPSALVAPEEVIGEEERDRLEQQWNQRFRRGGSGRVVVAESNMKVSLLQQSMGDLAALADMKATKEDIANAFHIPISFFTGDTNLANLKASEHQHMAKAVSPRLLRRDQKLNEQLLPLYDPDKRLFFSSNNPVPVDKDQLAKDREIDVKYGIVTVNEVRAERGLAPVPWGDIPWVPPRVLTYEGESSTLASNPATAQPATPNTPATLS